VLALLEFSSDDQPPLPGISLNNALQLPAGADAPKSNRQFEEEEEDALMPDA
jgi:hypothetical protein